MANFPTTPATGSYFETSGSTYVAMGDGVWRVAASDAVVKFSAIQDYAYDSLKLHLKFDGPNNSTNTGFTGSSQHARIAVPIADAKISTTEYVTGTSSAYFDGTGDYLSITNHSDFDLSDGGDFTLEMWIQAPAASMYIAGYGDANGTDGVTVWSIQSTGFSIMGAVNLEHTAITGEWYHFAVCRSGATARLFINGTEEDSTTSLGFRSHASPVFQLGRRPGVTANNFNGYLDEVRLTRSAKYTVPFTVGTSLAALESNLARVRPARPVEEVDGLLTLSLTSGSSNAPDAETTDVKFYIQDGPYSNTVLLLHCDGADEGTSFTDSSPSGHTVTSNGGAKTDNVISVFGTSSAYFDGTNDYLSVASSTDFNLGSSDFTIETWIFGAAASETVVSIWETTENDRAFELAITTGNVVYFSLSTDGTNTNSLGLSGTTSLSATSWYHLAAVRDGNMVTVYVNGVAEVSSSWAYSVHSTSQALAIGTERVLSPRNYLSGQLDEFRISTVCRYSGSQFDLQTKQFGRPDLKLKDGSGTYTVKLKQIN